MEGQHETLIWLLIGVIFLLVVAFFLLAVLYLDTKIRMEYWRQRFYDEVEEYKRRMSDDEVVFEATGREHKIVLTKKDLSDPQTGLIYPQD